MAFVHEAAGDRSGPGVHVLVVAPHCKVGIAVVQLQRQVADRVREVETHGRAGGVPEPRDVLQVEGLSGAVLHAGPDDGREARAVFGDGAFDRGHRERAVLAVWFDFDQGLGRVETVETHLRFQRVAVGRERAGFHQQQRAFARRAVETDQHQVQVRGQRVHRHHFGRLRADHARESVAHPLVVGHPRRFAGEMAFDGFGRPLVQHFLDVRACALRLQAQRIADEIGLRLAVVQRQVEFVAECAQRIGGVENLRVFVGEKIGHRD